MSSPCILSMKFSKTELRGRGAGRGNCSVVTGVMVMGLRCWGLAIREDGAGIKDSGLRVKWTAPLGAGSTL